MSLLSPLLRPILGPILAPILGANGRPLVRDTFTDADGTNLTAHTPEFGGLWNITGTWDLIGNTAKQLTSGAGGWGIAHQVTSRADVGVGVTFRWASGLPYGALVARHVDQNNFWVAYVNNPSSVIHLYQVVAGAFTSRGSVAFSGSINTDYRIVLICSGATITLYLNGVSQVVYSSATFQQTAVNHGLFAQVTASTGRFDNFAVIAGATDPALVV